MSLSDEISYQRWDKPVDRYGKDFEMIGFIESEKVGKAIKDILEEIEYNIKFKTDKDYHRLVDFIKQKVGGKLVQNNIHFIKNSDLIDIAKQIKKDEEKEVDVKKTKCSKCGKEYETYAVILDDNELSIISELEFREEHYNKKKNLGLCKECREKLI